MEQPLEWLHAFQDNWLAHLEKTGETNWSVYTRVRNKFTPSGKAVQLKNSRLIFITTTGAHLPAEQAPFDEFNPLGDYSIRLVPSDSPLEQLDFSNAHIDLTCARKDPQTLVPLRHLQDLVSQGRLGALAPMMVSFSGYHPHAIRVVKELVPTILKTAKQQQGNAALLIPVGLLCVQSAGLIARALEVNGIATTIVTNNGPSITLTAPPRAIITSLPSSCVLGKPNDHQQQCRTLETSLALLEQNAPLDFVQI
jgi:hypothetical protein